MNDAEIDKSTADLCKKGEKYRYFPSISDAGRKKEGKLPFLTPFYFKIKLLDRYQRDSDYFINWYTETTGSIGHYDEWYIKFGINENDNVHVWLGDLEEIPKPEQARFFADKIDDNKPSINFVRAELMCAPANLPRLTKIFQLRESINRNFFEKYKFPLLLDKENTKELISQICRPLLNSRDDLTKSLSKINKLFTESLNVEEIKKSIKNKEQFKGKGSIKVFEIFLSENIKSEDTNKIIQSFYILDDFRITDTHTGTFEKFKYCLERLNLNKDSKEYPVVYNNMLDVLESSLMTLKGVN